MGPPHASPLAWMAASWGANRASMPVMKHEDPEGSRRLSGWPWHKGGGGGFMICWFMICFCWFLDNSKGLNW